MTRYNERSLERANCNGVAIELIAYWARGEDESEAYTVLYIEDTFCDMDFGPDEYEYDTIEEGRKAFAGFVEEYRDKPNWNAQAAYDEAHGTINGEDAGIVAYRELVGEG